jgi:hypothetical protein
MAQIRARRQWHVQRAAVFVTSDLAGPVFTVPEASRAAKRHRVLSNDARSLSNVIHLSYWLAGVCRITTPFFQIIRPQAVGGRGLAWAEFWKCRRFGQRQGWGQNLAAA